MVMPDAVPVSIRDPSTLHVPMAEHQSPTVRLPPIVIVPLAPTFSVPVARWSDRVPLATLTLPGTARFPFTWSVPLFATLTATLTAAAAPLSPLWSAALRLLLTSCPRGR